MNYIRQLTLLIFLLPALSFAAPSNTTDDFLSAKVAVDSQIDATTSDRWIKEEVDRLVKAASDMLSPGAQDPEKLRAVRKVIYVAGPWNDNRPFAYDMSDPLGRKPGNQLLSHYLKTRLGNCVSMPILFLILADRLGVKVALARSPNHLFVRAFGPEGQHINIETTSGGYPARDAYYREISYITDAAVKNGVYLSDLTHEQTAEEMKETLMEWLVQQKRYAEAIALADEMLKIDPRNALALVWRGSSYGHMIQDEFESKYPTPSSIPVELRARYLFLLKRSDGDIDAAHAMGWLDESEWPKQAAAQSLTPPPPATAPPARS